MLRVLRGLRDTFATACGESKFDLLMIKALMNHVLPEDDVTEGYMRLSADHLRSATEKVSAFILDRAKTQPDAMIEKPKDAESNAVG